jgi:hypothetical protein
MAFQTLENDKNNRGQIKRKNLKIEIRSTWLELGHGNITFSEELDFDPEELDIVYADNDTEASQ